MSFNKAINLNPNDVTFIHSKRVDVHIQNSAAQTTDKAIREEQAVTTTMPISVVVKVMLPS